ncbi:glycosyltransferase family 4 protein [Prosthecobacter sp.]|uniref:glycosyltransferase family 4 protein n=1 Tax=Prosthecobacter sp. TaxID=1965333 RepID=UPI003783A822
MEGKYVCAFRGRRDSYQVPLALAGAGRLDRFITDAWAYAWLRAAAATLPHRVQEKVAFRHEPGIPDAEVSCLWGTTFLEHLRHRLGFAPVQTYHKLDAQFSLAAAARARQTHAHLFLYSPYAYEAFTARYAHTPRRVLFQYHPHAVLERRLLQEDALLYPDVGESFSGGTHAVETSPREVESWRHADLIFCASSFTRRSLMEQGCEEGRCRIVPYGIDVPELVVGAPQQGGGFQALFVGSGGQRKGLHHLLQAWTRARLPAGAGLTLVCRVVDRGIEALAAGVPGVQIVRGAGGVELQRLYAASTLFVMPSLVEGFGQVYLEALAQGCPVLGTANTCLPDLGTEAGGVFLTPVADVEALAARLEDLAQVLPGNAAIRAAARATAERFSWTSFRAGLLRHLPD